MPEVLMPRLSDTMEEGTIARWLKQPGDPVARGEVIAEVDTDKATMDLEAYDTGVLEEILVPEGGTAPIGQPVAVIGGGAAEPASGAAERDGATSGPGDPPGAPAQRVQAAPPATPALTEAPVPADVAVSASARSADGGGDGRAASPRPGPVRTSPLARALARRHGIDLAGVPGSGPGRRVVRADVEGAIAQPAPSPTPASPASVPSAAWGDVDEIPLTVIRRVTAERLAESARTPHFSLTTVVDAEALLALRAEVNAALPPGGDKVTVTDFLVKACARTLRGRPEANASWGGDKILRHRRVHVGVAVSTDVGLVVPVIRDADRATLTDIARQAHDLPGRARSRGLSLDELSGGTFTISNLGMYGIDQFTAVINPPQAAILAVGSATAQPVVDDGAVVVRTTMKMTLSVDHRVLDGATAAEWLADLRQTLEHPLRIVT